MRVRRGHIVLALVAVPALAGFGECGKSKEQTAQSSPNQPGAGAIASVEPAGAAESAADLAPPAPVVAEDPNIPLHEAVVGTAPVPADYAADAAPPPAVIEDRPPQPEPGEVWVQGYWWWSPPFGRYVWVAGAWRHPPPDQVWFPGAWVESDARFVWAPGYWGPPGAVRVTVGFAPPPLQVEAEIASPGIGFVWTPGYYAVSGGAYAWMAGSWIQPPAIAVLWVEPRYVAIGPRYYFQGGRWDYPPRLRGTVYRPDVDVRGGGHCHFAPASAAMVIAHTHYASACARAEAHGAKRLPGGGYEMHARPQEGEHHGGPERGPEGHGATGLPGPERHDEHQERHEEMRRGPAGAPEHEETRHVSGPPAQHAGPAFGGGRFAAPSPAPHAAGPGGGKKGH
jgi:hypothetical protein